MTGSELLKRYEGMLNLSQQMLTSAKQADWDRLIELEQARATVVDGLKNDDKIQWQGADGSKKEVLIRGILAADAETRILTEAWMKELQGSLGNISTEKKLQKAYGAL